MSDGVQVPEEEFGFDMSAVHEFFCKNVKGFEPHMINDFFDVEPDDPLMNMAWGARPSYRQEIVELGKLQKRLQKLGPRFAEKLGVHQNDFDQLYKAACDLTDYSLQRYTVFFGHENRGKPNWPARTVARLCYVAIEKCGRKPTVGTEPTSDRPTGEYGKLVDAALKVAGLEAHWNSQAIWAKEFYTASEK